MSNLKAVTNVKRLIGSAVAAVALGGLATTAQASLIMDVRAVGASGTGIELVDAHSVTVAANASGFIQFELYALIENTDGNAANDFFQSTRGRIATVPAGAGNNGVTGDLVNSGTGLAGRTLGLVAPFNGNGSAPGTVMDSDTASDTSGDLDIGGTTSALAIAIRSDALTPGASHLVYRFELPVGSDVAKHMSINNNQATNVAWLFNGGVQATTYTQDGVSRTAATVNGNPGHGTPIPTTLTVGVVDPGEGDDSVITLVGDTTVTNGSSDLTFALGGLLKGAVVTQNFTLQNTGPDAGTVNVSGTDPSFSTTLTNGTSVTAGGNVARAFTLNTATIPNGNVAKTLTITNTKTAGAADGNDQVNVSAVVGLAVAAESGTQDRSIFGGPLTAPIPANGSYAGLSSETTRGGNTLGTKAEILNGSNGPTPGTVAMKWRTRATDEKPGTATNGPIDLSKTKGLVADVVDLTGIPAGQVYVLQMSYDDTLFPAGTESLDAQNGLVYLVTLTERNGLDNANTAQADKDLWVNAVATNTGGTPTFRGVGAWDSTDPQDNVLGAYGVDPTNNRVWAVVNHNSQFSVVPEPATFSLLGLAAVGFGLRRRRNA